MLQRLHTTLLRKPVALARIGGQRELRDQQDTAVNLRKGKVHLAGVILDDDMGDDDDDDDDD